MYNVTPTEQVCQSFAHVDWHWPNHRRQLLDMYMFARSGYFSFSHTLLNTVLLLYYYSMLYYIKTA